MEFEGSRIESRVLEEADKMAHEFQRNCGSTSWRWSMKCDRRHMHITGKSETVSECRASFVVAMLSTIKRQMISYGELEGK